MSKPIFTFQPPYLRPAVPSELANIQQQQQAMMQKKMTQGSLVPPLHTASATLENDPWQTKKSKSAGDVQPAATLIAPAGPPPRTAATASLSVTVTPAGPVSLGFNCKMKFHATNNFNATECEWSLQFKNPAGLWTTYTQWLGYADSANYDVNEIYFDIDFTTYSAPAYAIGTGSAIFRVMAEGALLSDGYWYPAGLVTSNEVKLDFNGVHCVALHNIVLSTNSVKGGANGQAPTMTVYLDAPAPPQGQLVELSTDSTLGSIAGSGNFTISAGQQSGAISWFLSTKSVYTTGKSFNIVVKVNASTGYALMNLTK